MPDQDIQRRIEAGRELRRRGRLSPEQDAALAELERRYGGGQASHSSAPARPQLPEWPEDVADRQAREANPQEPQRDRRWGEDAIARTRGNSNVFFLGGDDEIIAGMEGLYQRGMNLFRSPEDQIDPSGAGANVRNAYNAEGRRLREEYPANYAAGQVLGGVSQAVTTGRTGQAVAPRTIASLASSRPIATAAATGAVEGGIYGFNDAEGGIGNRLMGGGGGAVLGAIAGPVTMAAIGLGRSGVNWARGQFPGGAQAVDAGVDEVRRGAVRFAERFGLGREVRSNPAALSDNGGDFVAERLGPRGEMAARYVAGRGDEAQRIAEQAVAERQAGRGGRVSAAAARLTGVDDPTGELLDMDVIQEQARPLFQMANREMVEVTPRLRGLIRRLRERGLDFNVADQLAIDAGVPGVRLSAYADDIDGLPPRIPLGALHALKVAANAEADAAFTAPGARRALGPAFENAGRELRDLLRRSSSTYSRAIQMWGGMKRNERAFEIGGRIFENRGAMTERDLRRFVNSGLAQSERRAFLAGVADAINRRLANQRSTGNPAALIDRNIIRFRLREFLGEDAADEMMSRVDFENLQASFEGNINRRIGSQTSPNEEAMRQGRQAESGRVRAFMAELVDNPLEAIRGRGARRNMAELIRNGNDEDIAEVARLLFSTGDVSNDPLVRALMREAERRGVLPGGASLSLVAPAQDALTSRDQ